MGDEKYELSTRIAAFRAGVPDCYTGLAERTTVSARAPSSVCTGCVERGSRRNCGVRGWRSGQHDYFPGGLHKSSLAV